MTATAAAAAMAIDRLLGEPPVRWHPVVWFGSTMSAVEQRWWSDDRARGAGYAVVGVAVGIVPAATLRRFVGSWIATAAASAAAIAGTMLEREARNVGATLVANDVAEARRLVGRLVGRATDQLDEKEIARAVIETVAENTVDAVTATVFWATIGGAVGALGHRAINTMDAMVGHRTRRHERFGFVAARLDDAANWLPARLTAMAVAVAAPSRAGEVWQTVRRDACQHPSPNGGVVEAAFAGSLGVRLGGANVYGDIVEHRGNLGDGRPPTAHDVDRAITLARKVGVIFVLGAVGSEQFVRSAIRTWQTRTSGRD